MSAPTCLDRSFLRVSGPDTIGFLNNLLTADVEKLAAAHVLYAALLSPQGKLLADMLLWAEGAAVLIECDPARADDLTRRLSMYKLRANVSIEDASTTRAALVSIDPFDGARRDPRLDALGWRGIGATRAEAAAWYDAHRLTLGLPDLARDAAAEEVFALEALLDELGGVDFQKGCFVGQENVSRMKRRATTRKKFCPITFDGDPSPYGAIVRAGAAELGQVRTSMNGRAMALLRLDRALEAMHSGQTLEAEGRAVKLDPPAWLLLPPASGAPD